MLPHPKGEAESIRDAFGECRLGLKDVRLEELDDDSRDWVRTLNDFMRTDGIPETSRGAWVQKAEQLSDEEKSELSHTVDELAHWFHRRLWNSASK